MTQSLFAFFKAGELALCCLSAFLLFHRRTYATAESGAFAIFAVLLALLAVIRTSLYLNTPVFLTVMEVMAVGASLAVLYIRRGTWIPLAKSLRAHLKQHVWLLPLFYAFLLYLGACAILNRAPHDAGPHVYDFPLWYKGCDPFETLQVYYRGNELGEGWGFFSYLAYLMIGFSTYALARRHAWPETAVVVTLIVLSLPRLVLLSTAAETELIVCSLSLLSILCLYRTIENPTMENLFFLVTTLVIGFDGRLFQVCFNSILLLFCCLSLYRRHGATIWIGLARSNVKRLFPLVFLLCLVALSTIPVAAPDEQSTKTAPNFDLAPEPLNTDGIHGAGANLTRFLFSSLHPGEPLDSLSAYIMGTSFSSLLDGLYAKHFQARMGGRGLAEPFRLETARATAGSWFGPLGFLLILPAICFALLRGSRRLKGMGLALFGYCFLVALVFAWTPAIVEYFSLLFTCGGYIVSHYLPPWRLTRKGRILFMTISLILMAYTAIAFYPFP